MYARLLQRFGGYKKTILSLAQNQRSRQSLILFGAMLSAMVLNFISSVVTARLLGPERFGDVKFVQIFWGFVALTFSFGFHYSGSRVLLLEKDADQIREIVGANLVLITLIGVFMAFLTVVFAYPIDLLFKTKVAYLMIWMSPLVIGLPLRDSLVWLLQSMNKIYALAVLNSLPFLLYVVSVPLLLQVTGVSPLFVLLAQQLTLMIVIGFIFWSLKPKFTHLREWLLAIFKENKKFGWPVYVGALANGSTAYLNSMAVSYWMDNTALGFYALALRVTDPLKMLPGTVATSSFRDFANQKRVPRKVMAATIGVTVFSLLGALILFGEPLSWIYTQSFASVGPMARVAAFGAICTGLGDFYNRFLGAHGKGKELRNTAFFVGVVNVVGFLALVPLFGAWGGIATTVLAGLTYLSFMLWHYNRS